MTDKEQKIIEVVIRGQQANASIREMQSAARILNAELRKLPQNSEAFKAKMKELQDVNKRLKSIQDDVKGVGGVFNKISAEVKAFGLIAIAALGFQFLTSKVQNLINQNAKLSDSFADIRKTTGMTAEEVQKLNKTFSQMNTRTTTENLRSIAIAAGQLGIAKKDIVAFTAATDKLVVALGDEFTGGAEQVTKEMGGLRNIFSDIKSDKIDQDMLHIGNAINELGAAGMATGPVVTDFATRIGGVGIELGLTSGQVLGLSATMQELSINAERGGTAITKILLTMTQKTEEFAHVAGMSTKDFQELISKDLYGAFVKVAEGSNKGGQSAIAFAKILDNLGIDGAGASEVFAKLGNNTKLLKEKVDLANKSLTNTDSIMNEFDIKNQTFAANLDKLGKSLTSAFVSGPIMKGMQSMAAWLVDITTNTHASSEALAEEKNELELNKIKVLSLNVGNKERTEIIKKLQEQYPEMLANLDAEKSSNEKVRAAIDGVINSMANKIVLQRKQEDVAEQAEDIADKTENRLFAENKLIDELNRAYQFNISQRQKLGKEKVTDLQNETLGLDVRKAAQHILDSENSGLNKRDHNLRAVGLRLRELQKADQDYNVEVGRGIKLQKEADELKKRLGIQAPKAVEAPKPETNTGGTYVPTQEELKAAEAASKKQIEDNKKMLDAIADQKVASIIDDEMRERAQAELANARRNTEIQLSTASEDVKSKALESQKEIHEKNIQDIEWKYKEQRAANHQEYLKAKAERDKQAVDDELNLFKEEDAAMDAAFQEGLTKSLDKELEKNKQLANQQKANEELLIKGAQDLQKELADTIFNAQNARIQREKDIDLQAAEAKHNSEAASLQARLTAGKITQKQFDKEKLFSDNRYAAEQLAIKKKAFEDEKRMKIAQIGVNLIMELSNAALMASANPLNAATFGAAGITQFATMAGIATVRAGIQVAAVAAQKFAKGGYNKTSNNPQGYTSDATLFTNSASGAPFIAGEQGREWIAPNWMLDNPKTAPIIEHLEAVRQNRGFASGGSTSVDTSTSKTPELKNISEANGNSNLTELAASINKLNGILSQGIEARLDYDRFKSTEEEIDNAKSSARIG
jgi:TP901 family phage tail tape measure protein